MTSSTNKDSRHRPLWILLIMTAVTVASIAYASGPDTLLEKYRAEAKTDDPQFKAFSADAGKKLYFLQGTKDGDKIGCFSCHTNDPLKPGKSRAGKIIEPLAPSAEPTRFTDEAKVEKWFRRNCGDVLGRACTAKEKGDFITWMKSVR